MGVERAYRVLVGKPEGKNHLGDPCIDGKIILRWIFRKWDRSMDWIYLTQERNRLAGACECRNEHSGSIKCGEFRD